MHVVDPVAELERELRGVEELRREVTRVEVDAERLAVADRVERLARRHEVVGDLGRMHLEPEANALGVEDVHDRPPPLRELLVAALDLRVVVRRERVDEMPDRRAGEAVHLRDAELRGGARRVLHALGGARAHAFGIAVAVHLRRQDRAVALVDPVADGLADEVRAERPDAEAVPLEQLAPSAHVAAVGDAPGRPRSGRPSRRARGRRSPSLRSVAARSSIGRSAHWPVKSVTGRAMQFLLRAPVCADDRPRPPADPTRID